jgi:hypothetical protein
MSRPSPSPKPIEEPADWVAFRKAELLTKNGYENRNRPEFDSARYVT